MTIENILLGLGWFALFVYGLYRGLEHPPSLWLYASLSAIPTFIVAFFDISLVFQLIIWCAAFIILLVALEAV